MTPLHNLAGHRQFDTGRSGKRANHVESPLAVARGGRFRWCVTKRAWATSNPAE